MAYQKPSLPFRAQQATNASFWLPLWLVKIKALSPKSKLGICIGIMLVLVLISKDPSKTNGLIDAPEEIEKLESQELDLIQGEIEVKNQLLALKNIETGQETLDRAAPYWDHPELIWYQCNSTSKFLNKLDLETIPFEILKGSVEVIEKLQIEPHGNLSFRAFCENYSNRRRSNPSYETIEPMPHDEAIASMIQEKLYSNELP